MVIRDFPKPPGAMGTCSAHGICCHKLDISAVFMAANAHVRSLDLVLRSAAQRAINSHQRMQ
jgi:hypothetical protein